MRDREGEETHAPFNHGLCGLRASSNAGASFKRFTSTPCGPDAAWLGPRSALAEAKHLHCLSWTHRQDSRLVGCGHSMLGDDMPRFDTPAADVTI